MVTGILAVFRGNGGVADGRWAGGRRSRDESDSDIDILQVDQRTVGQQVALESTSPPWKREFFRLTSRLLNSRFRNGEQKQKKSQRAERRRPQSDWRDVSATSPQQRLLSNKDVSSIKTQKSKK